LGLVVFRSRIIATAVFALMALAPAEANWLSELGEIAATGGKVGKLTGEVSAGLEGAARLIAKLPASTQQGAIAAEAMEGGAWRFRNAGGDTITATSPEGVRGALTGLAPDLAASGGKLSFYVSEDSAFAGAASLDAFPAGSSLYVIADDAPIRMLRSGTGDTARLYAELDGSVLVAMTDQRLFAEALWQLKRPLGKSGIRIVSLEVGGPSFLPSVAKRSSEGLPQAEIVNATDLGSALRSLRGQTVVVTGQIEGEALKFTGVSGADGSVRVADLMAAVQGQDVNLLLLDTGTPKQPGGTTWLWQERGIAHLDAAMAETSLGDFISALGRGQGRMEIAASWGDSGHLRLTASPVRPDAPAASGEAVTPGLGGQISDISLTIAEKLAGHVVPNSATASLNSRDTQWDLDNRLIPGIPAGFQISYAVSWLAGLLGFSQARRWWRFLTRMRQGPPEWPWRLIYEAAYWLVFAPLIGPLALAAVILRSAIEQAVGLWRLLTSPFRRKQVRA
jgi:hypothetical protein